MAQGAIEPMARYAEAMGQQRQPTGFGDYLLDAIHAAGYATATEFARDVDTDPSVVLRWISEEQRPTIRSIERIAPKLDKSITEIVNAAYQDRLGDEAVPVSPPLNPIVYEVGRLLADDSPMPEKDRQALLTVITRMIEPYRRRRANKA